MPRKAHVTSYADYLMQSNQAAQRYARSMAALREALTEVQKTCPHTELDFEADPAGGHDSYHFCKQCGAKM